MNKRIIRVAEPVLDGNEKAYVMNCLDETWISSRGKYIDLFERKLAEFVGVSDAVVTNNGTTALHLALVAAGIQAGDEVIMPTLSYVATANAVRYCGATPVFVDSEPNYLSIDTELIEAAITPRTKAIMPVPLYGHPVDMDAILDIAQEHNLLVIEDAAEAIGSTYKGQMVGSMGDCAIYSFFGNKTITTGEGGAIVTNRPELAKRMRFLRGQAVDPNKNYWHPEIGYNYRMTNIAAAIGVAQTERIGVHLARRRQVAKWYHQYLWSHQDLLQLPHAASWAEHSYWMYTVVLKPDVDVDRNAWMSSLADCGIETRPVFYPIHWMPAYQGARGSFPVADRCSATGINLPTHGKLTESDVEYVCDATVKSLRNLMRSREAIRRAA